MASAADAKALVNFYLRVGYGRQLIALCDDTLKRRGTDPVLTFWRAFGSAREGNFAAAIRDAESLRSRKDSELAALTALVYYHRNSKQTDREALLAVRPGPRPLRHAPPLHITLPPPSTGRVGLARGRQSRDPRCPRVDGALSVARQPGAFVVGEKYKASLPRAPRLLPVERRRARDARPRAQGERQSRGRAHSARLGRRDCRRDAAGHPRGSRRRRAPPRRAAGRPVQARRGDSSGRRATV